MVEARPGWRRGDGSALEGSGPDSVGEMVVAYAPDLPDVGSTPFYKGPIRDAGFEMRGAEWLMEMATVKGAGLPNSLAELAFWTAY